MAKERLDRAVRRDPLHDRHRLLGRLAHPAAGRQRLPRPLPGHPAGLLVPRRVVDRPAARGLQPDPPLRRGPVEVGARRGLGPALDRRRRGPPQPRQLDRLRQRLLDRPRRAGRRLRRRARRPGLRRRDQPRRRALHAGRPDDQRLRPARAAELRRHPARQRRRPVGAVGAAEGPDHDRPSSSTSTRRAAGSTSTPQWQPQRTEADSTTMRRAYRSGAINSANHLDQVAIIDLRGPDPGAFHDAYRSWAIARPARARARPLRQPGHLGGPGAADRRPALATEALLTMDRWLAAVEQDGSARRCPRRSSPTARRTSGTAAPRSPPSSRSAPSASTSRCRPATARPATVAGESIATDTNKCALKPLRRADYYPIVFTPDQWARLQRTFPIGVCDWSRPALEQQGAIPWQTYQEADGSVIYGGRALEPAPLGSGWTSFD